MKRLTVVFFLALTLALSFFSINAGAASAEIIDSAVIEAVVNADGTVSVKEKWTVSYISAADFFNRYIDTYSADNSMSLMQKYDEVKDVSVKIDGNDVKEAAQINSFVFCKAENGRRYEVVVNCPSAQTAREYEISYTLTGAVKKQGSEAVFAHMFIGKEFLYTSNNVEVTVKFPDGTQQVFSNARVYDTFSVEARADKSLFESGALVKYSAAAETVSKAGSAIINALPVVIAVILAIAIMIFVLFTQRLVRLPREKAVKRLIKNAGESEELAMPEGMTACECYKLLTPVSAIKPKASAKKVPSLFAMAILECAEKGYIAAEDDRLVVGTPANEIPAYLMSALNFLKVFAEKENDRYVIDARFAEKVSAECIARYDIVTNYLATFYSLIKGVNVSFFRKEKNKELYEKAYAFRLSASAVKHKPSFAQCMADVLAGRKTSSAEIFSMLYSSSSPDKLFSRGGNAGEAALCDALSAMSRVYTKSK